MNVIRRLVQSGEFRRAAYELPSDIVVTIEVEDVESPSTKSKSAKEHVEDVNFRSTEINWLAAHIHDLEQYQDGWIAVEGDEIVASGPRQPAVYQQAKDKGIETPFLMRIPRQDEKPFIGIG